MIEETIAYRCRACEGSDLIKKTGISEVEGSNAAARDVNMEELLTLAKEGIADLKKSRC